MRRVDDDGQVREALVLTRAPSARETRHGTQPEAWLDQLATGSDGS